MVVAEVRGVSTIEEESTQRRASGPFGARVARTASRGSVVRTRSSNKIGVGDSAEQPAPAGTTVNVAARQRAAAERERRSAERRSTLRRSSAGSSAAALSPRIDPVAVSPGSQAVVQTLLRQGSHEGASAEERAEVAALREAAMARQRSRELVRALLPGEARVGLEPAEAIAFRPEL